MPKRIDRAELLRRLRRVCGSLDAPKRSVPGRVTVLQNDVRGLQRFERAQVTYNKAVARAVNLSGVFRATKVTQTFSPRVALQLAAPARQLPSGKRSRKALARAGRAPRQCNVADVAATVDMLSRDPDAIPQPIAARGCKPRKCAADAPEWGPEYQEAVAEASERAAIESDGDEREFKKILRRELKENPHWGEWQALERECLADFRAGHTRTRKTSTGSRETRRVTRELEQGSAEHLDSLTPAGRAAWYRRHGQPAKARKIEAQIRAAKRGGARGHRAA